MLEFNNYRKTLKTDQPRQYVQIVYISAHYFVKIDSSNYEHYFIVFLLPDSSFQSFCDFFIFFK